MELNMKGSKAMLLNETGDVKMKTTQLEGPK